MASIAQIMPRHLPRLRHRLATTGWRDGVCLTAGHHQGARPLLQVGQQITLRQQMCGLRVARHMHLRHDRLHKRNVFA